MAKGLAEVGEQLGKFSFFLFFRLPVGGFRQAVEAELTQAFNLRLELERSFHRAAQVRKLNAQKVRAQFRLERST